MQKQSYIFGPLYRLGKKLPESVRPSALLHDSKKKKKNLGSAGNQTVVTQYAVTLRAGTSKKGCARDQGRGRTKKEMKSIPSSRGLLGRDVG